MKKVMVFAASLFLLGGAVGAATGIKISAELKPQTISVDGSSSSQQVISYKGSTYVPLRSFGELVGVGVDYKDSTIYLGGGAPTTTTKKEEKPQSTTYSMNNPAPIGISQSVGVDNFRENYNTTIVVKEIIRGNKALEIIKETNKFNDDPEDGCEYILAKIGVSIQSSKDGKSVNISKGDFKAFTGSNAEYSTFFSVVTPQPGISEAMYEGSSCEGWVPFQVKKEDASPKFVFGSNYDGTGGIWFSLK